MHIPWRAKQIWRKATTGRMKVIDNNAMFLHQFLGDLVVTNIVADLSPSLTFGNVGNTGPDQLRTSLLQPLNQFFSSSDMRYISGAGPHLEFIKFI